MASKSVYCICEGIYENISYGERYLALETDADKQQIKIQDNRNRNRWYPQSFFAELPPHFIADIALQYEEADGLSEATITFSDGSRRWCIVATTARLANALDSHEEGYLAIPHLLVVRAIDGKSVEAALNQLLRQGRLFQSSLPIEMIDEANL